MLFNKINRLVPLLTHHKLSYQSFTFKILKLREKKGVFGSKDQVERKKTWRSTLLMGKSSSNYMRVRGKHFEKEDYICNLNNRILKSYFEMIYFG
jgi:hypothetical protein